MNAKRRIRRSRGYISYVMVLSIGAVLTMLMIYAYRDASQSMVVASGVQQRADYLNKEDAALRSLLAITPNRAIRAMQSGSNASTENSEPLTWQSIFQEALVQSNAGASISSTVASKAGLDTTYSGNTGDSTINNVNLVFQAISPETGYVASGCSSALGTSFPPALNTTDVSTASLDKLYPIISSSKHYGSYASGRVGLSVTDYPQFNLIPYPKIDFGYGTQGENFVAKRNWWAFSVNLYNHDNAGGTSQIDQSRDYVLSIYEIPSQLSISSNAFTSLGQHESGDSWQNISVEGSIYASKAQVEGATELSKLSSRRGMSLSSSSKIGAQSFTSNPFTPGLRETYEITTGDFYPVSLSSETGRAAFVPINRETEFYDRYADGVYGTSTSVISPTNWNDYSVGALQCAMKLDVTEVISSTDQTPKQLVFTYKKGGVDHSDTLLVDPTSWATATPPVPFDVTVLSGNRPCVVIKPEQFAAYLTALGADSLAVNNSIAVNANYRTGGVDVRKPSFPCLDSDVGLILTDCTDLTSFTKGFSVVTNFRLYIADDFNIVSTTPPSGISGTFFPPASLYAPERRFGSADDPWKVEQAGTVGSLASDDRTSPIRPFDLKTGGGSSMSASKISVNLKPITHPGALPPITMMNWLILLEEKRE